MKIAVVILNWNGKQLLAQFLPSIITHNHPDAKIYVADNNSSDDSVNFLRENFENVTIIQNEENGGYAKGYNDALQHINTDIYCLINSDVEVSENWLEPIIAQFEKHPEVAAIQPKILDHKEPNKFEYAGAAGGYIDAFGYPFCRGRIFTTLEKDEGQYDDTQDIFWASGACFFVRSEVFHRLNGFDEDYFAHQEEIDLCWRIRNAGLKIQYVPDSVVYHVGGATLSNINPKKTYLNFRNSLFTLVKNLPKRKVFFTVFSRLCLDALAAIKFLFELKPRHAWAVIRSHISFYNRLSYFYRKRSATSNEDENYYSCKSIVWSYYMARKKKFSQL